MSLLIIFRILSDRSVGVRYLLACERHIVIPFVENPIFNLGEGVLITSQIVAAYDYTLDRLVKHIFGIEPAEKVPITVVFKCKFHSTFMLYGLPERAL